MRKKYRSWVLPVVCYALAVVLYAGGCTALLVRDVWRSQAGELGRAALPLAAFGLESAVAMEPLDGRERFVSTDPDPHLIYAPGEAFAATLLVVDATAHKPPGEMLLYYETALGEGFSEQRKLWARRFADGRWYFDLGGRRVSALRLDPDAVGGVIWTVGAITLNENKPYWMYYLPDARVALALLALPGLAAMALREGRMLLGGTGEKHALD